MDGKADTNQILFGPTRSCGEDLLGKPLWNLTSTSYCNVNSISIVAISNYVPGFKLLLFTLISVNTNAY